MPGSSFIRQDVRSEKTYGVAVTRRDWSREQHAETKALTLDAFAWYLQSLWTEGGYERYRAKSGLRSEESGSSKSWTKRHCLHLCEVFYPS